MISLLVHETPLNVRLNAAEIRFAQSKFRMSKHSGEKEKREKPVVQTNSKVTFYIITNL